MTFAWPEVLWLLLAPAALLARDFARRYGGNSDGHPNILRAEAGTRTLSLKPLGRDAGHVRWFRFWLCAGLALGIAALARPQWGRVEEPMFSRSREIILALDLSRSMLTQDVKPSRLERAKLLAQSLLVRLEGERVGLISFAGTAFLQSPLSSDYAILGEILPQLGPDYMPVGGTNYGAMMDTAAAAFSDESATDRFLIVLTDGGANDDDWRDHIKALARKGVRVVAIGVGTGAGGFIPDGSGGFMKDERGAVVLARLESDNLRELAEKTGGVYRDAGDWIDLAGLLKKTVGTGRKGSFIEQGTVRQAERFQWLLGPSLFCLLVSFLLEFPVRPAPRDLKLSGDEGGSAGAAAAAGLMALLLAWAPGLCPRAAAAGTDSDSALLGRVVGRLSGQDTTSAIDWAELARETVAWGQGLRTKKESVPPGPVRDALSAVDSGSALDSRAADWPRLRGQLEELLRPPKEEKQPPPPPKNPSGQNRQDSSPKKDQGRQQQASQEPPPSQGGTQKVGGSPDRRDEEMARKNPELAPLLEKLDQLRGQDSPAELWRKMDKNEPRPPSEKPGNDW